MRLSHHLVLLLARVAGIAFEASAAESFGAREGDAETLEDLREVAKPTVNILEDPFTQAQAPNTIFYSVATKHNSQVAFMLAPNCENTQVDPEDPEAWKYFAGSKSPNGKGWQRRDECKVMPHSHAQRFTLSPVRFL
jgi:hypothetical protein